MSDQLTMKWVRTCVLVCVLAIGSGCFGTSQQPVYYALEGVGDVPQRPTRSKHTLAVTRFDVRAPYDRPELVYRAKERQLRFYPFDLWAGKPGRMMAEAVTSHLDRAGLFADVSMRSTVGLADYELRGEIITIEELDVSERDWRAHLAMRFELLDVATGEVVMRHAFDTLRPVSTRKVSEIAKALDEILGAELATLTIAIDEQLARTAGR